MVQIALGLPGLASMAANQSSPLFSGTSSIPVMTGVTPFITSIRTILPTCTCQTTQKQRNNSTAGSIQTAPPTSTVK